MRTSAFDLRPDLPRLLGRDHRVPALDRVGERSHQWGEARGVGVAVGVEEGLHRRALFGREALERGGDRARGGPAGGTPTATRPGARHRHERDHEDDCPPSEILRLPHDRPPRHGPRTVHPVCRRSPSVCAASRWMTLRAADRFGKAAQHAGTRPDVGARQRDPQRDPRRDVPVRRVPVTNEGGQTLETTEPIQTRAGPRSNVQDVRLPVARRWPAVDRRLRWR